MDSTNSNSKNCTNVVLTSENGKLPQNSRDKELKWNGWGYADSSFYVHDNGKTIFKGERYEISGRHFPELSRFMEKTVNSRIYFYDYGKEDLDESKIPSWIPNENLIKFLNEKNFTYSTDGKQRAHRSHGHNIEDMVRLRLGECDRRIPDIVVWPKNHQEVVDIVKEADILNCAIIPIGGGTSVSSALKCPENERRCIVSLDMAKMNNILWIDEKNLVARAECGILGGVLEKQLNDKGFTLGHEPDSLEFSSLGGWVATRASGIKKNKYGNIEDILVHITLVTPAGIVQKSCMAPRMSTGPDIHQFIIGSEGTLGVVTEVTFKICYLPACKKFGSILFPTFDQGVLALREIAKEKIFAASIRLMDNEQFLFGQALKPEPTIFSTIKDHLKQFYVTKIKKFDWEQMAPATLVFEGNKEEVALQEKRIYQIASKYGGFAAGEENGRYGYMLTFVIAYLRDIGIDYFALGESFETSAPWDRVSEICHNVKELCAKETKARGIKHKPFVSCRVTQLYDSGACIYFYFGFNYHGLELDPGMGLERLIEKALHIYEEIEVLARDEILRCGGCLSHHHGIGKLRKRWLPQTIGEVGMSALEAVKGKLDPHNVFACGNLFTVPTSKL